MDAGRLVLLSVLACAVPAQAELYKWTDGEGRVHYSDQPPTVNAQTVKHVTAGQSEATAQATQSLNARDQDFQKRRKEAEDARAKAKNEAAQARVKRENCARARNNLGTLHNTPRVYTTNAAGQRIYMDDAARADALANSQKAVSDFCE